MKTIDIESSVDEDELQEEYHFDYAKAKPNRFARDLSSDTLMVVLDPDVAEVFSSSEEVNRVLRALIETMPRR
ncbi:MAG: hypothetical protein GXP42_05925 [Chloroflexi bacterium]|nr:hypothetical protein [Chloroflexota bacterium]